ncbi:FCD domain-containing protein [Leucobacter sp. gxy201]|uniref:FadR/GntR family transcriptional regulator n=1 Tax=Leucobacter sp. gxy201 TaxID=2957200 RepID=UPI003DA08D4D
MAELQHTPTDTASPPRSHRPEFDFDMISGLGQGTPLANPFEQVMAHLVSRMHTGELPFGTRLPPERELSDYFEVSRVTLRAVIRTLQQSGYLRTLRGRSGGSTVIWQGEGDEGAQKPARLSSAMQARLLDSLAFRSILEPGAAELAATQQLTAEQEQELLRLLEEVTAAGMNARIPDAELHGYIGQLSGCKALSESIDNLQLLLNEQLMQVLPEIGPAMDHSNEQHERIVKAILRSDPAAARTIMHEHVEATRGLIVGFIR